MQLYLALSGVLASGGSEVLSALAAAEAELAAIGPEAAKNKVFQMLCLQLSPAGSFMLSRWNQHFASRKFVGWSLCICRHHLGFMLSPLQMLVMA